MEVTKGMTPVDIADAVFGRKVDARNAVIEENRKKISYLEKHTPIPAWNVPLLVKAVRAMAAEAYRKQDTPPRTFGGSPQAWADYAEKELRTLLIWAAREPERYGKEPDKELLAEIYKQWPETAPPRPLNDEEIGQLKDLQAVAEEVIQKFIDVTGELDKLWEIIEVEREITSGTAAQGHGRIERLLWWTVSELYDHLRNWTAYRKGAANGIAKPFANRPNGW